MKDKHAEIRRARFYIFWWTLLEKMQQTCGPVIEERRHLTPRARVCKLELFSLSWRERLFQLRPHAIRQRSYLMRSYIVSNIHQSGRVHFATAECAGTYAESHQQRLDQAGTRTEPERHPQIVVLPAVNKAAIAVSQGFLMVALKY